MRVPAVGLGRRREPVCFQLVQDETIDRRAHPIAPVHRGHGRPTDRLKRPPVAAGPARRGHLVGIDRIGAPARARGEPCLEAPSFQLPASGDFGGISSDDTRSQSRLSSGLPGTIALPLSPPASAALFRERSSFPLGSGPEWQSRHRRSEQRSNLRVEITAAFTCDQLQRRRQHRDRGQAENCRNSH